MYAVESLIIEKVYDKITVQDLIDRADLGRSTFCAHYETKHDYSSADSTNSPPRWSRILHRTKPTPGRSCRASRCFTTHKKLTLKCGNVVTTTTLVEGSTTKGILTDPFVVELRGFEPLTPSLRNEVLCRAELQPPGLTIEYVSIE